jgi:pyridoxal 5'-phosphate synthase pdxT subunit
VNAVESNYAALRAGGPDTTREPHSGGRSAAPVTIGVLALQGAVREHLAVLTSLGVPAVEVRRAADLARVDGLILPGGESTTMSMLIESAGLLPDLHHRLATGMPAFGTCAGMILLATDVVDGRPDQHFFGAIDIEVRRNAFGRQVDSFETDLTVDGLDTPLHAVFIRAPVVERVGPEVDVLATVDGFDGAPRPVVCRQGAVLVAAFHPELTDDARLHRLFVSAVVDTVRQDGRVPAWDARVQDGLRGRGDAVAASEGSAVLAAEQD